MQLVVFVANVAKVAKYLLLRLPEIRNRTALIKSGENCSQVLLRSRPTSITAARFRTLGGRLTSNPTLGRSSMNFQRFFPAPIDN